MRLFGKVRAGNVLGTAGRPACEPKHSDNGENLDVFRRHIRGERVGDCPAFSPPGRRSQTLRTTGLYLSESPIHTPLSSHRVSQAPRVS